MFKKIFLICCFTVKILASEDEIKHEYQELGSLNYSSYAPNQDIYSILGITEKQIENNIKTFNLSKTIWAYTLRFYDLKNIDETLIESKKINVPKFNEVEYCIRSSFITINRFDDFTESGFVGEYFVKNFGLIVSYRSPLNIFRNKKYLGIGRYPKCFDTLTPNQLDFIKKFDRNGKLFVSKSKAPKVIAANFNMPQEEVASMLDSFSKEVYGIIAEAFMINDCCECCVIS